MRYSTRAYDPVPPEPPDDDPGAPPVPVLTDVLLTRSALHTLPDPQPLIGNVLDQGTVAVLYGMWGSAKSFIAQDWAASVATGRRWQGRPTERQRTLYVAAEGAYGLKARLHAWEVGWRTEIPDGTLDVLPRRVNLTRTVDVGNLEALIDWGGYSFVVLDTLARCMVGSDENSAKDCGVVVDALTRLRERTPNGRGVVLGVHHTGKDGKTLRGSSAFEGGADTVYSVIRDGATFILDREKRKDGPKRDTHRLSLDPIEGTGSVVLKLSTPRTHATVCARAADVLRTVTLKCTCRYCAFMSSPQPPSTRSVTPGEVRMEAARTAAMVAQLPAVISDRQFPYIVRQAALDSFYMHVRTLIEYLEIPRTKSPKHQQPPQDFKASSVVAAWTAPTDAIRNTRLNDYWTDASKHFVHFSQLRPEQTEKTQAEIHAIADDVLEVWNELAAVSTHKDGFVPTKQEVANLNVAP
ncbi:AAA family ATPase [Mycolicibacterium sp. XJ879]